MIEEQVGDGEANEEMGTEEDVEVSIHAITGANNPKTM